MTTVPAIKGKIGDKLYFQCTMNAKDLIAIKELPDIIKAGIESLKIEGRMKSKLYFLKI